MINRRSVPRDRIFFILSVALFSALLLLAALFPEKTQAAAVKETAPAITALQMEQQQGGDLACRICHEQTDKELSFPSGETIPVQVDLSLLDHSAHGMQAEKPLECTDCHQPVNDYQVPHEPVETFEYRDYQLQRSVSCERCHQAPHLTSHPGLDAGSPVGCTDCHGAHDVQTIDDWRSGEGAQVCVDCHTEQGIELTSLVQLNNLIQNGMFTDAPDSKYCLSCHSQPGLTMTFPNGDTKFITVKETDLHNSVHGVDNTWQALECADCHEIDSFPHDPTIANSAREHSLELNNACLRCHEDIANKAQHDVHAAAQAEGKTEAAVCIDCHGYHDTPVPDEPRERISHTCEQCHSTIFSEYETSVHGAALLTEGNPDVPTCINCHGVHDINDPTTALARSRSPQLCAGCHADKELMSKYDISTDVFETYVADFHGTTVELFESQDPTVETNKAVCYDCHGVHNILAPDDPHAGIKDNLLVKCQECHPDATDNFSDAWTSHFKPSLENNTLVYLVDLFYLIVIPSTIAFFVLMISSDVFRRVRVGLRRSKRNDEE